MPATYPYPRAISLAAFSGFVSGDTDAEGHPLNTVRPDELMNRAEVRKIIALAAKVATK